MRYTSLILSLAALGASAPAQLIVPSAAHPKIQSAIDAAAASTTITVLPGVYLENLDLKGKTITLASLAGAAATILDGGGTAPVIRIANGETRATVVQGFTIRNGMNPSTLPSDNGAGINIINASPTILECVLTGNVGAGYGGGIGASGTAASPSSPSIRDCKLVGNLAQGAAYASGAGIAISGGSAAASVPEIRRCEFRDNVATWRGGAIYFSYANCLIEDCLFTGNKTTTVGTAIEGGGAIYPAISSTGTIRNNVIAGNSTGGNGGGVKYYSVASSPVFVNNTIYGNPTGAVAAYSSAVAATFTNCILWGNGPTEIAVTGSASTPIVNYCDVAGGSPGTGNISSPPLLANPLSGNARLLGGSPCIDAGDSTAAKLPALDFEGDPRILGAAADIGADERVAGSLVLYADRATITLAVPGTTTFTLAGGASRAGLTHVLLASLSGTSPGLDLFGKHLALNPDALSLVAFPTFVGVLDSGGGATPTLALGSAPLNPALNGLALSVAAGTFAGLAFDAFSNPERVLLVP